MGGAGLAVPRGGKSPAERNGPLDTDLPEELRDSIAYAFRELLLNAVEWGGKLDPKHTVRISYLRAKRMVMYRIADPGPGFNIDNLPHAAISQPDSPTAHIDVRDARAFARADSDR